MPVPATVTIVPAVWPAAVEQVATPPAVPVPPTDVELGPYQGGTLAQLGRRGGRVRQRSEAGPWSGIRGWRRHARRRASTAEAEDRDRNDRDETSPVIRRVHGPTLLVTRCGPRTTGAFDYRGRGRPICCIPMLAGVEMRVCQTPMHQSRRVRHLCGMSTATEGLLPAVVASAASGDEVAFARIVGPASRRHDPGRLCRRWRRRRRPGRRPGGMGDRLARATTPSETRHS